MKYFIYAFTLFALLSCKKEPIRQVNTNPGNTGTTKPNGEVNSKIFDVINLDYPGLEKAKALHAADKPYEAVKAILSIIVHVQPKFVFS